MCGKERTCGSAILDLWQLQDLPSEIMDLWQIKELEGSRAYEQAGKATMEFGTLRRDWYLTIKNHVTTKYRTCQDKFLSG